MLGAVGRLNARSGVEHQRIPAGEFLVGERPLARFRVGRQRVESVLREHARGDFKLSRRRRESRLLVFPELPFLVLARLLRLAETHPLGVATEFLEAHRVIAQDEIDQRVFVLREQVTVTEAAGELHENPIVAARLPERLDDTLAQLHIARKFLVAPVLEVGGGRQHEVGILRIRGHEPVGHHEQIERGETPFPQVRIRVAGQNRCPADDQRLDRIGVALEDRARRLHELGALGVLAEQRVFIVADRLDAGRRGNVGAPVGRLALGAQHDAAGNVEVPRNREQYEYGAQILHPAVCVFQPRVHRQGRVFRRGDGPRGFDYDAGGHAGDAFHFLRGETYRIIPQFVETDRPVAHELLVVEPLSDDDVDHAQSQRAIGARADRDPLVCYAGGVAAHVIDGDHPHPLSFRRQDLADRGRRRVGRGIGAPDHDQARVAEIRIGRIHAEPESGHGCKHAVGGLTYRTAASVVGGAEREDKALGTEIVHAGRREHLDQAAVEHAPADIRHHGLGPRGALDLEQALRDAIERRVPRDALETPFALGADSN